MMAGDPRMKMELRTKVLNDRQELILRLRKEEGMSLRQIAEGLHLSPGRVGEIERAARRKLEEHEENLQNGMVHLPARVRNILSDQGFTTRWEILDAVQSGRLYYDERAHSEWGRTLAERKQSGINVAKLRNAGRKTWMILMEWLGLPAPDFSAREPSRQSRAGG